MKETPESHVISNQRPPMAAAFGGRLSAAPGRLQPVVVLALSETSPPSESLRRARALADSMGAALHLVRVLPETEETPAVLSRRSLKDVLLSVERTLTAHRSTRAWMRDALPDGRGVERFAILHGEFIERIAVYAREAEARLILVPALDENAGVIVTRLADATGTPVLLARAPARQQTIVAATDLQDPQYPVLQLAAALGQQLETRVIAVHNVRLDDGRGKARGLGRGAATDRARAAELARLRQASQQLPAETSALLRHDDDPVDAILAAARAEEADLVVVGTRPRAWFERGPASVASTIVNRAQRSVLVAPVGEKSDPPVELAWG